MSIYFQKSTSDDSETAYQHHRVEIVTIQCGECGVFVPFKITGRNNGLHLNILTDGHNCEIGKVEHADL